MDFYTIGVYNTTEEEFFNKLIENKIDTFCDIRQRRGVRGSKYAFVNSNRLQQKLNEMEIKYGHLLELAPSQEIRDLQKEADAQKGEQKRERQQLGQVFVIEYKNKVLTPFDFEGLFEKLNQVGAKRIVLFCVEEHPEACHRSIVAERLKENYNFKITHL
jgi:uncharacterized protein (DUF488 family)